MSYLKSTSEFHYNQWFRNRKPKIDKRMITVEDALLFAEWLHERYVKLHGGWKPRYGYDMQPPLYTTKELWELYQQQVLGKKPG